MSVFPHVQFLVSAAQASQFPPDHGAEVAFAGRSNAGKSSAINTIVQRNGLARVSKTPGRTRLLNFFTVSPDRRIVDLPGYGYAAAPDAERRTWAPMMGALRERECLRGLVLIVDSRRGVAPTTCSGTFPLSLWRSTPANAFARFNPCLRRHRRAGRG